VQPFKWHELNQAGTGNSEGVTEWPKKGLPPRGPGGHQRGSVGVAVATFVLLGVVIVLTLAHIPALYFVGLLILTVWVASDANRRRSLGYTSRDLGGNLLISTAVTLSFPIIGMP
jgi:hypothetical protein